MCYVGRAVPALPFGVLRVDFDKLREVATVAQGGRNRAHVGLESIGADLEVLAAGGVPQALDKGVRGGLAAAAQRDARSDGIPQCCGGIEWKASGRCFPSTHNSDTTEA
jgi:hypothetical protein